MDRVLVSSREDAWHLLGGCVSREQLNRFRDVALLVLDENNPALDLVRSGKAGRVLVDPGTT